MDRKHVSLSASLQSTLGNRHSGVHAVLSSSRLKNSRQEASEILVITFGTVVALQLANKTGRGRVSIAIDSG